MWVRVERRADELVVSRDGARLEKVAWPGWLVDAQDEVLAGDVGRFVGLCAKRRPGLGFAAGEFGRAVKAFGGCVFEEVMEPLLRVVELDAQSRERVFVDACGEACVLPFEAAVMDRSGWPLALAPAGVSVIRVKGRPSDEPLWGIDPQLRVLVCDAIGAEAHTGEHVRAIAACVGLLGGQLRTERVGSSADLLEAVAEFGPTVLHVIAHGMGQGRRIQCGSDGLAAVELAEAATGAGVRVAILSVCESAGDAGSLAEVMLAARVPVVIAARARIHANAMAGFALGFYGAFASGYAIDECVRAGRRHMGLDGNVVRHAVLALYSTTTDLAGFPGAFPVAARGIAELLRSRWHHDLGLPFAPTSPEQVTPDSPASWLRPLARAMPFHGRDSEFDGLECWRDTDECLSVAAVVGDGGMGKTRLAMEFVERSIADGWTAGLVPHSQRTEDCLARLLGHPSDVLAVFDYAETPIGDIVRLVTAADRKSVV